MALLAVAFLLILFAVVRIVACRSDEPIARGSAAADATPDGVEQREEAGAEPMSRLRVVLYYPAASGRGLVGEMHEIFQTAAPGDLAKQIVIDLISGPLGTDTLPALPQGTELRQVYVVDDVAYVDFSSELKTGIGGGSLEEQLVVYSIVNSVALNVPGVSRVGILVDGKPVETLNGHMDLTRPLRSNRTLIVGGDVARVGPAPGVWLPAQPIS